MEPKSSIKSFRKQSIIYILLIFLFLFPALVYSGGPCPRCSNAIQDCTETGVDCGGACIAGKCSNGIMDCTETGVDCGGDCITCAARCSNSFQDADETGVDCGGTACISCAARCSNSVQDGDETGVDCGGADCVSCSAHCSNSVQDADETGVDCGGADCLTCGGPTLTWAKSMGGPSQDYGTGVTVDGSGNVYTIGRFQGTADFDPGAGTFDLTSFGGSDIFISKLDASGNFVWAIQLGGSDWDVGNSITLDGSGNIYISRGLLRALPILIPVLAPIILLQQVVMMFSLVN